MIVRHAATSVLDIAYEITNEGAADTAVLLHGFPYDVRAFDEVVPVLANRGYQVVVPYLRGFGGTRFLDDATLRSGQQAALGQDLIDLLDALDISQATVAGHDWGGRTACIVAALHPERVTGLVSVDGYSIQDIAGSVEPMSPRAESTYWYQYYFQTDRGYLGLERNREELCELLWRSWSPTWKSASDAFTRSAPSLHNPDFVDVATHSYRHRYGLAAGDPRYAADEESLAGQPFIAVPTIVLNGDSDGVWEPPPSERAHLFTGPYEHRTVRGVGHNVPQEAPADFARAVIDVGLVKADH
jgi:pimeloyl-ACP methyl ester carboxylesterase